MSIRFEIMNCSLTSVALDTPNVVTEVISGLIASSSSTAVRELLNNALNNFISILLRSTLPALGQTRIESDELTITVEKLTRETNLENDDYRISEAAKQFLQGGIIEILLVRFASSPYSSFKR